MKNKFLMSSLIALLLIGSTTISQAQDTRPESDKKTNRDLPREAEEKERTYKVRPFRIGVKVGAPNLIGGNLEYVLPMLGRRVALNADYSNLKSEWLLSQDQLDESIQVEYLDLGLNFYLFKPGKGLYAGVSYGTIKAEATRMEQDGTGYINEEHSSFNVKLGAKLGGLFYFRPEVGYSFSPLPASYEVHKVYNDGTQERTIEDWDTEGSPAELLFKGLMFNIGFGFAF